MDVTHLHDVDDVIWQPEDSKGDDDGEHEVLTANPSLKLCLSQMAENTHVTADDDGVREQKPHHCLQAQVEHLLFTVNNITSHCHVPSKASGSSYPKYSSIF